MPNSKAKYILEAEDRTKLGLKKASKNFKSFGSRVSKVSGLLAAVGAGMGFSAVIAATKRQEQAMAQLEQRLKSTGGVSGYTAKELEKMAGALQKLTTFGDEAVMEMQSLLLTFTNVRGGVFEDTTKIILDMSVAMNQDLKTSALAVGKALNDPVKGLTALSRVGVQFTNKQKAVIKSLQETGDVAGAQRLILQELQVEFGGSAAAAADTFGGALDQLGNAFGDLLEQKGGLNDAKSGIKELTAILQDPAIVEGLNSLISGAATFAGWMAQAVSSAVEVTKYIGEEIEANIYGVSYDDIVRLEDQAEKIRESLAGGFWSYWNGDEQRAELKLLESQIEAYYNKPRPPLIETPKQDNPTGASYTVNTDADKNAARIKNQFTATLTAMQRQLTMLNTTTQQERVLWEIQNGRYANLTSQQQNALLQAAKNIDQRKETIQALKDEALAADEATKKQEEYDAELASQAQKWRDLVNPVNDMQRNLEELDLLLEKGKISWETYGDAVFHAMDGMSDSTDIAGDEMDQFAIQAAREMQNSFSDFLFDPFNEGVEGMLRGFVKTIHKMVSELLAQQMLSSFLNSMKGVGGWVGVAASTLAANVKHSGGIAGSGPTRQVSPLIFANAPRYHSGGIAGLQPTEVPAILQQGEGVFTKDQMAAMDGGGTASQSSQPSQSVRVVFVDDQRDIGKYMAGAAGEKVILNVLQRNAGAVKQVLV
ncbi:phage tail length tape measure family protein [Candidatus Vondammii sp. HM_W22]|uniref:phage tail length tape measure family protein n=1 Tax=Candidatus Vondammii sp. HM_W22 TaxID=2687299 RepID=UPI002E7AFEA8|nr:phage tail length tape measure family protein [Candidatus Vondammii sp. HM_W22]